MRRVLLALLLTAATAFSAFAQLGPPKITVRDTMAIVRCEYNNSALNPADWPSKVLVEDAICVEVAGYSYTKGPAVKVDEHAIEYSWSCFVSYYKFNAKCNGKTETLTITRPHSDCSKQETRYEIGRYTFYAAKQTQGTHAAYSVSESVDADKLADVGTGSNAENGNAYSGSATARQVSSYSSAGWSLKGRSAMALPTPSSESNKEGKIIVKIWVDRSGKVLKAEAPEKGSTISDVTFVNKAKEAAKKAKFNADYNATETQVGTITYVFRRNN